MDNVMDIRPRTFKLGNMEDGTIKEVTLKPGETAAEAMDRLSHPDLGVRRSARVSVEEFPDECSIVRHGLGDWMNYIQGANASASAAARRILRPAMFVMHEMMNDGYEVIGVTHKHPKKKKVVDQAKEGWLRKKELAAKFMTRQRIRQEEKLTPEDVTEHAKKMFDSLDRRAHVLMVSTPSGNDSFHMRMLQHLHDTDAVSVLLAAPFTPTVFETEMQLTGSAIPHNVVDLQAERRKLSSHIDQPVFPETNHSAKYFPFYLKEKDDEQGATPPDRDS